MKRVKKTKGTAAAKAANASVELRQWPCRVVLMTLDPTLREECAVVLVVVVVLLKLKEESKQTAAVFIRTAEAHSLSQPVSQPVFFFCRHFILFGAKQCSAGGWQFSCLPRTVFVEADNHRHHQHSIQSILARAGERTVNTHTHTLIHPSSLSEVREGTSREDLFYFFFFVFAFQTDT